MGIVVVPTYGSDPATVNAANLDAKVSGLATEFNGGIDNDNIDPAAAIAATKLSLATIAQAIAMSSKTFQFAKGADVASASSIALGTDGNFFDITGTTTIQTITAKQAGCIVALHFDGALTLTDDTGNLELNGANVTISAEDNVILVCDGTNWHMAAHYSGATVGTTQTGQVSFVIDGGGDVIATGVAGDIRFPYAATITGVYGFADQSGSVVVDLWKDTYANYPPIDADSICDAGTPLTLSAAVKGTDTTLTSWTTSITAGDTIRFNVDSCATITRFTYVIEYTRTLS